MVMIWLIKILFDSKLRAQEKRYRKALIEHNNILLEEMAKVERQFKSFTKKEIEDDLYLQAVQNIRIREFCQKIKMLNLVINILFVNREHINKIEKFIITFKDFFNHIVDRAGIYKKLDGFAQKVKFDQKVINRLKDFKVDNFVTK
jgi:hypothetical protein